MWCGVVVRGLCRPRRVLCWKEIWGTAACGAILGAGSEKSATLLIFIERREGGEEVYERRGWEKGRDCGDHISLPSAG